MLTPGGGSGGNISRTAFLPAEYQGIPFNDAEIEPEKMSPNLRNPWADAEQQRRELDVIQSLNRGYSESFGADARFEELTAPRSVSFQPLSPAAVDGAYAQAAPRQYDPYQPKQKATPRLVIVEENDGFVQNRDFGYSQGFRASVVGRRALGPLDLEREFGLIGGDIFHGKLELDQLFSARPVLGHADYRMPVPGLYLCGAGAHPGGGVTGLPGRNAALGIIQDFKLKHWMRRR